MRAEEPAGAARRLPRPLVGGVAADRLPKRALLIAVETVRIVSAGVAGLLAVAGLLELWHLALIAFGVGAAEAFFLPAYSALLPTLLPPDELLAANGVEGTPAADRAVGARTGARRRPGRVRSSPGWRCCSPPRSSRWPWSPWPRCAPSRCRRRTRPRTRCSATSPRVSPISCAPAGCSRRRPSPRSTFWSSSARSRCCCPSRSATRQGAARAVFALVLAAVGVGGAVGSIVVSSLRLPRRYLTVMILLGGAGAAPLALLGITRQLWVMAAATFVVGFTGAAAMVIWRTLLQRRVPPRLLGRVSSLDFLVSLALMPVSMALAGPVGEWLGVPVTFVPAGGIPVFLAVAAILGWRLPRDEIAHPLDAPAGQPAAG